MRELLCGLLSKKYRVDKLHELRRWKLLRYHGTVSSHGALLSRYLLWHNNELLPQLRHWSLSTCKWILILCDMQLGHVSIERRCIKLF